MDKKTVSTIAYLSRLALNEEKRIEKMGNLIQFLMDYIRFLNYKHYKELTEEKNKHY